MNEMFAEGLLSEDERYSRVINLWNTCTNTLRDQILPNLILSTRFACSPTPAPAVLPRRCRSWLVCAA